MLRTLTFADLESGLWAAAWELGDGQPGFVLVGDSGGLVTADANLADLEVSPCSERSELGDGFDELVAVRGRLAANGAEREIDCLGRRGEREALDPMACESVRDVAAWFAPDDGLALIAARAAGAKGHEDDLVTVSALQAGHVLAIEEPRLSTTYDGVGAPARAGMELWPEHEDDGERGGTPGDPSHSGRRRGRQWCGEHDRRIASHRGADVPLARARRGRGRRVRPRTRSMSGITAVISDFGGVLTSPLLDSFAAFQNSSGISIEELGSAMAAMLAREGKHPLFELETGRLTEADFLRDLGEELSSQLGRTVELHGFGEQYFEHLHPNGEMIEYMRSLHERGYKLAICTNNVREWERLWRAKLPVDELFEVVVDSGFVGMRKPEPEIYELTLERLGVAAEAALLVDDIELNCDAARALGIEAVWFRSNEQAIAEIEAALA